MKSGTNWGYDEQGAIWEETVKRPFVFSNFQKKILQSYLIIIVGGLVDQRTKSKRNIGNVKG